jgi:nitrosocyanin
MENITNVAPTPSNNSNNTKLIAGVVAVAALAVIAVMVMSQSRPATNLNVQETTIETSAAPTGSALPTTTEASDTPTTTPSTASSPASSAAPEQEANVVEIKMDAGSFFYSQKEIRVKKGDTVKITMTSKDMMHDFNIDELKVKSGIVKSGETKTFEFVADKTGSFEYYCAVGSHRQNGQVGTLVVE